MLKREEQSESFVRVHSMMVHGPSDIGMPGEAEQPQGGIAQGSQNDWSRARAHLAAILHLGSRHTSNGVHSQSAVVLAIRPAEREAHLSRS